MRIGPPTPAPIAIDLFLDLGLGIWIIRGLAGIDWLGRMFISHDIVDRQFESTD